MKKAPQFKTVLILFLTISLGFFFFVKSPVYSQTITDLEKQIEENAKQIALKEGALGSIEKRIADIKGSNSSLSQKIQLMTDEINKLKKTLEDKEAEIETKGKEIESKQEQLQQRKEILDLVSAELYMETRNRVSTFFLSDWSDLIRNYYVRRNIITDLRVQVEMISGEFGSLAEAKEKLDLEKTELDTQKKGLDDSLVMLATEKAKLQAELSKQYAQKGSLSSEITDLTKKVSQLQSALIAARSAGLISSGGYTGSEQGLSISQAPVGYFGVFSIGAYTHRNGMSQWGAKARSEAGQTSAQILSAYYPGGNISQGSVNVGFGVEPLSVQISVDGYGSLSFEDYYLMGIQEMPESWSLEALKAQAIAARTYAIRYTNNGRKNICTTQTCQVFGTPLKTGAWKTAVEQTRGQILVDSTGAPILTQYAAVHGGWVNNVGWDTQSGGGTNWFNDSWERISGVTWFYKSWYKEGYTSGGESCGHTPYLSPSEMAIMLNAYLIKNNIGLKTTPDKSRLLPSDYGICPGRLDYGRADKVPYSLAEMQNLLTSPVTTVNSVSTGLSNGSTTSVIFSTNRGAITISGFAFKDIYNQMAPGHMRIQQQSSYAYFNVEKR